jgi:rhamnosyltransferase
MHKVVVLIPAYNPGERWKIFLEALSAQTLRPVQCVVIDSESDDGAAQLAASFGIKVHRISRAEFNHGGTRQLAVDQYVGDADVVVFLTQDAILADKDALQKLVMGFEESSVAAVYGRQLPSTDATPVAAHARLFNYLQVDHTRRFDDVSRHGIKTCFLSNSFAAYRAKALREVGGFPLSVILGEDMHLAARLLMAGHSVSYASRAQVYHSHNYSLLAEFRRYFDIGVFHSQHRWLLQNFGGAGREGLKFLFSEISYLLRKAPWRLPEAACRTVLKATGYRMGLGHASLSHSVCRALSMNKGYWT